uniref:uncharacterized protein LOC109955700 n=1 Tax=Monopterus albus TaxID=43700 RepID=UPI0009B48EEE|nr:uncharacterized protein LOC109955700 [Monopterus albus]
MSDLWMFSSSSPPPIMHQSSLSDSPAFVSSPPPLCSPSSFNNHGNHPHHKVTSSYLCQPQVTSAHLNPQVTSPNLPHSQVTSPHSVHQTHHLLCQPQVTSPHYASQSQVPSLHHFPHAQVASPHLVPQAQVTSPYHLPHPQVTSPHLVPQAQVHSPYHLPHPQATSPHFVPQAQAHSPHHLPHPQVTSPHLVPQATSPYHLPHPQVTSPHLVPQAQVHPPHHLSHPQVTSPHRVPQAQVHSPHHLSHPQVTSPHLLSPPQSHLSSQNHNPGLDDTGWSRPEASSELSSFLSSYSFQIQTTDHLDLHLQNQNQNQFNTGQELENTETLSYNSHTLLASGIYAQGDTPGSGQDTWGPLEPTLSQFQYSPLGSIPGGVGLGRWSSVDFSSSSNEDFSNNKFFPDSYHDNNAPQPFCSPTTPSPHYSQTPTISSPGPEINPRMERLGFHTQPSIELNTNKTLSCCLHEPNSYPMTSDPAQLHPHQISRSLLPSQTEPIQDQSGLLNTADSSESCFSPREGSQDISSAAQSPGPHAGLNWRHECGGGGGRRGGDSQLDWTWMKWAQHENSAGVPGCRLLCTMCQRDFRSVPALNGHMRSHSGLKTLPKKGEDSSLPVQPSIPIVIPVSVPVQSRGVSKACTNGQRTCSRLPAATGGAVLYRSLMHLEKEVTRGRVAAASVGCHYIPPPMLCPLRAGPGLHCSLATRREQRVQAVQLNNTHNGLDDLVAMETLTKRINKPQINVGRSFQAEIPPLCEHKYAHSDSHSAVLLWTPRDELEHPINQNRVEALLTMARSSVIPGGGASPEYTLHILSQSKGDFLLTVEKLLSTPETSNHTDWSAAERKLLVKALQRHHKDFSSIQRAIKTKSLSQCVEFYYLWKKKLSLTVKTPARLTITLPNTNDQRSSSSHDAS